MDEDDVEVIEITAKDCPVSTNKKKRAKVVQHDVIEIRDDEDQCEVIIINERVNTGNKRTATPSGSDKNRANHLKIGRSLDLDERNTAAFSSAKTESSSRREKEKEEDEVSKKFRLFKQFDTVHDHSDHHYIGSSKSTQAPKNWAKTIQNEWKILEKDLPDTIFVRVYEERMDLLRAVIIGAAGTPYQDGLFFFDLFFPPTYPNNPPQVHYHSGGLRLNPNLYNCGKVCLSLLNTWGGSKEEKWIPRKSTVLQVLLSIQALVLNAKPYFNEPGWAPSAGGVQGENASRYYSENVFILSCRTMLYALRRPPKHFEDFVVGHFRERAHAILVTCKAYMEGVQVGCLAEGGVQDVDEEGTSGSQNFKQQVVGMVESLVPAFTQNGAKDCEQFLLHREHITHGADNTPHDYNSNPFSSVGSTLFAPSTYGFY